ncbi:MAG: heme-binding domain-containing protein, partial [Desulfovibrionaceae bacterium]
MKVKASILFLGAAFTLVTAGTNLALAAEALPTGHPPLTKFSKVSEIMQDKCMACHTSNYQLPFYAKIPGIKDIIEKDYKDGLRAMDLNTEFTGTAVGKPVSEVVLAKMEWVIQNNTMPPAKFTAVHWSSRLTDADKKTILDWVKNSRANHYATKLNAKDKANEPLQALPKAIPFDAKKAALGDKLFNDKRLSGDDTVACVTCHA